MIHNKYFEILKQFLGDYKCEIYGRELVDKVPLSQKGIALALEELEAKSMLKSRKEGTLKHYSLNLEYSEIRDIIAITEITRKIQFLTQYRKLAYLFKHDERVIGIFGSYAKGIQKTGSDIDVFIIGKKIAEDYDKKGKKLDLDISIKYFSRDLWVKLLKEKNNLLKEIINYHIAIFGVEEFINLSWRHYYGFD